jgi:hypothetical protein
VFVIAGLDKGMLARIQRPVGVSTETTCMSGIGNLGRKRVEWRRNANVKINHFQFPRNISLQGLYTLIKQRLVIFTFLTFFV